MNRIAKAATDLSSRTRDREKMKLDEVIAKYPEGITIDWLDLREGESGTDYVVFTFKEEPRVFSSGGGDFLKLWELCMAEFVSCISDLHEYLRENPTRVKVWKTQTKSRKTYTCVSVIQEGAYEEFELHGENGNRPERGGGGMAYGKSPVSSDGFVQGQ